MRKIDFTKPNKDIKFITTNLNEVKSIFKDALKRYDTFLKQINDENMSKYVFENLYESIREISECIVLLDGLKIYSHEMTIIYIYQKNYLDISQAKIFDDIRDLRNKSKYYGKTISHEKIQETFSYFQELKEKLSSIYAKKIS